MPKEYDVTKHVLVPKHSKLSEKEKKELFEKYVA
ncbi:MAG: DNA-directed RNA polymerase subunit RpoH/Rpb5 C-terminal domain-containing protein, partial [Candidatus Woesearchaeota archaeon]